MGRRKRSVDELKPCPFCGGRASLDVMPHKGSEWAAAECTACGASTDVYKNAESAIESWNTRWGMHGMWKESHADAMAPRRDTLTCSVCGGWVPVRRGLARYRHCPHCGAEMNLTRRMG